MTRNLFRNLGVLLGVILLAAPAFAETFDPTRSAIGLQIGGLREIKNVAVFPGQSRSFYSPGDATLSDDGFGGKILTDTATIWQTTSFGPGTSLFTGVPDITNLKLTVVNGGGTFMSGLSFANPWGSGTVGPTFGGNEVMTGQAVIFLLGGAVQIPIDLAKIGGAAGGTIMDTISPPGSPLTVTAGPFIAGSAVITGIEANLISIGNGPRAGTTGVPITLIPTANESVMTFSTGTGYVSTMGGAPSSVATVTVSGSVDLPPTGTGVITLISPMRVNTGNLAGSLPGIFIKKFTFIPEPGTMLLLVSGAVGLVAIGRKRMRK